MRHSTYTAPSPSSPVLRLSWRPAHGEFSDYLFCGYILVIPSFMDILLYGICVCVFFSFLLNLVIFKVYISFWFVRPRSAARRGGAFARCPGGTDCALGGRKAGW